MEALLLAAASILLFSAIDAADEYHIFVRGSGNPYANMERSTCDEICTRLNATCDGNLFQGVPATVLRALVAMTNGRDTCQETTLRTSSNALPNINRGICEAFESDANSPVPDCSAKLPSAGYAKPVCFCRREGKPEPCPPGFYHKDHVCLKAIPVSEPKYIESLLDCYRDSANNLLAARNEKNLRLMMEAVREMGVGKNYFLNQVVDDGSWQNTGKTAKIEDPTLFANGNPRPPFDKAKLFVNQEDKLETASSSEIVAGVDQAICRPPPYLVWKKGFASGRMTFKQVGPKQMILESVPAATHKACAKRCYLFDFCFGFNWRPTALPNTCDLLSTNAHLDAVSRGEGPQWVSASPEAFHAAKQQEGLECQSCG